MSRLAAIIALGGSLACAALTTPPAWSQAARVPIPIVAAENFYGDIAQQIGGAEVKVRSVLSNPGQDPHLFSTLR